MVNEALGAMERDIAPLYSGTGRPSIAPERLLRAMLLQAFYSIRSERQLMERIEFDPLFRWFVGLGMDDPVWDHSIFSKNRDRLLEGAGLLVETRLMQAGGHVERVPAPAMIEPRAERSRPVTLGRRSSGWVPPELVGSGFKSPEAQRQGGQNEQVQGHRGQ